MTVRTLNSTSRAPPTTLALPPKGDTPFDGLRLANPENTERQARRSHANTTSAGSVTSETVHVHFPFVVCDTAYEIATMSSSLRFLAIAFMAPLGSTRAPSR